MCACLIALGLAVLGVLWPRRDWEFAIDPQWSIANDLEPEDGDALEVPGIHRDIALHMGASARRIVAGCGNSWPCSGSVPCCSWWKCSPGLLHS